MLMNPCNADIIGYRTLMFSSNKVTTVLDVDNSLYQDHCKPLCHMVAIVTKLIITARNEKLFLDQSQIVAPSASDTWHLTRECLKQSVRITKRATCY